MLIQNTTLVVTQLTQWRQFEDDQNNPSQMAKYFSSPSKSQPSVYSQDEIYYLLGENNSMKKLLNEVLHCFFLFMGFIYNPVEYEAEFI